MTTTASTLLGRPVWYELMTSDTAAAERFYTNVIGWTASPFAESQQPYTVFKRGGEHFSNARMFLNVFLDLISADQQLVQTNAAFIARTAANLTADVFIQCDFALFVAEFLDPLLQLRILRSFYILLP